MANAFNRRVLVALALVSFVLFPSRGQTPPLPKSLDPAKTSSHTNWLGWDDTNNPPGTRYRLLIGWSSGLYTMTNDAGTNKTAQVIWPTHQTSYYNVVAYTTNDVSDTNGEVRLPQMPRTDTNILVTVKGTNLFYAFSSLWIWRSTNGTMIVMTNPTGQMWFRGSGRTIITRTNF